MIMSRIATPLVVVAVSAVAAAIAVVVMTREPEPKPQQAAATTSQDSQKGMEATMPDDLRPAPEPEQHRPNPNEQGVPESEVPITNETPMALMTGSIEARARQDKAWLARTLQSLVGKPMLTDEDLHTAHREYLWGSIEPKWQKTEAAFKAGRYTLTEDGDSATFVFEVDGGLGQLPYAMIRVNGAWYFVGA